MFNHLQRKSRSAIALILTIFLLLNTPLQVLAATITVNTLDDTGTEGDCELRDAINSANSNSAVDACNPGEDSSSDPSLIDVIDFSTGSGTVNLNGSALPTINQSVNINGDVDGDSAADITIDAAATSRILDVNAVDVTVQGVHLLNGDAPGQVGGAVRVAPGASLNLINSTVEHPLASFSPNAASGGAIGIEANAGKVVLDNVQISNTSANSGGAISIDSESSVEGADDLDLEILNSTITDTSAAGTDGGALSLGDNTEVKLENLTVTNTKSARHGGAIYHAGETSPSSVDTDNLLLNNVNITSSEASSVAGGKGGCIYLGPSAEGKALQSLNLNACIADLGGAIYQALSSKMTILENSGIAGSTAKKGAGIYGESNAKLSVNGATFTGNVSEGAGGAIHLGTNNILDIQYSNFNENYSGTDGGAVYLNGNYNLLAPTLNISNSTFSANTAIADGGAICLAGGSLVLDSVNFNNNLANLNGGALALKDGETNISAVVKNSSTFTDNSAIYGGDINTTRLGKDVDMEINNASFSHSASAGTDGGAIYNNNANVTVNQSTFLGGSTALSSNGGAIYNMGEAADFIFKDSSIQNFQVNTNGGAIYNLQGNLTLDNSTIQANTAVEQGGGVYSESNLDIQKSYVGENFAGNGGGLYIGSGKLNLTNSTIGHNMANSGDGGGVFLSALSSGIKILASTLASNSASKNGGGLSVAEGVLVDLQSTIIASNSAENKGPDCENNGTFSASGYNLFGDSSGCGEVFQKTDLRDLYAALGDLDLHGGSTLSFALLGNSPAINKGLSKLLLDQRGVARPQGGKEDIGSYEYQDKKAPIIKEITPITSPVANTTPEYTFSTDEDGTITYGGTCSSETTTATVGNVTITFNTLAPGEHSLCTITVIDVLGNISNLLALSSFTVIDPAVKIPEPTEEVSKPVTTPAKTVDSEENNAEAEVITGAEPEADLTAISGGKSLATNSGTTAVEESKKDLGDISLMANENVGGEISTSKILTADSTDLSGIPVLIKTADSTQRPEIYQPFTSTQTTSACDAKAFATKYNLKRGSSGQDSDKDGLSDSMECRMSTNPTKADSDNDGKSDSLEALSFLTDPNKANQFVPAGPSAKEFLVLASQGVKSLIGDDKPLFQGQTLPGKKINVYLFDSSVFDQYRAQIRSVVNKMEGLTEEQKEALYNEKFNNEVALVLQKIINKSLDPNNPDEAKFIGKAKYMGDTVADENGVFVLGSDISLRDNNYLAMGVSKGTFSQPIEFTLDSKLALITPVIQTIDNQKLTPEILNGQASLEISPGVAKPVLTGQVTTPSRVVALWKSTVTGSALLADSLDQEFRLTPPEFLEPGEHTVYLTAYRTADNAQSKTQKITFRIQAGAAQTAASLPWLPIGLASLVALALIGLIIQHRRKPVTMSSTSASNNVVGTAGSATSTLGNPGTTSVTPLNSTPSQPSASSPVAPPVAPTTPNTSFDEFLQDSTQNLDQK
jgi:hypothetical protein